MGIRFRRSIRLFPGFRVNVTGSGLSATVGPRGASVNVGSRGTYANVGLPGTGISSRTRLDVPDSVGDRVREFSNEKDLTAVPPYRKTPVWPWVLVGIVLGALAVSVVRG